MLDFLATYKFILYNSLCSAQTKMILFKLIPNLVMRGLQEGSDGFRSGL